ncbi:uncharacterized protein B0T15DRAFT_541316 [Chaetomium strumarium]|uniref:Jacalin-type lectin domain-containing protein n=1 Tax=Chaetomium strumarium TaxID=1170767 RepID=A0AAJ0LZZ0_9PEZI|nr:hypothetical protein B0T15DRAFT_541316 [Chaetomium strumarium]
MATSVEDFKHSTGAGGAKAIVNNEPTGGSSTHNPKAFDFTDGLHPVEEITVWVADGSGNYHNRKLIKALKVKYRNNGETTDKIGNETGTSYTFTFDKGDKVESLVLWTGDRVDRIELKVANRKDSWIHGGTDTSDGKGGTAHEQELGNGILLGFKGKADDNELLSLGAIFQENADVRTTS